MKKYNFLILIIFNLCFINSSFSMECIKISEDKDVDKKHSGYFGANCDLSPLQEVNFVEFLDIFKIIKSYEQKENFEKLAKQCIANVYKEPEKNPYGLLRYLHNIFNEKDNHNYVEQSFIMIFTFLIRSDNKEKHNIANFFTKIAKNYEKNNRLKFEFWKVLFDHKDLLKE